jgi:hypothetical protein
VAGLAKNNSITDIIAAVSPPVMNFQVPCSRASRHNDFSFPSVSMYLAAKFVGLRIFHSHGCKVNDAF